MMQYRYDVFLCHSSSDKVLVRRVATALRNAGLKVWFDDWVIEVGDDVYLSIEAGLEHSRALVLIISSKALSSDWVDLERSTALFRDPTNKTRRFIPVIIDNCQLPDTLRRYRYFDLRQISEDRVSQLVELCRGSKAGLIPRCESDDIDEYRAAHISKYYSLVRSRKPIRVMGVCQLGQLVDAKAELDSWLRAARSSRFIVLGDPGSGKTYLLRHLCSTLCEGREYVPIFINAGQLRNLRPTSREHLLSLADPPVPNAGMLDFPNVVMVIDGLDELIGPACSEQVGYVETLAAIDQIIPKESRVILSCRSMTFEATSSTVTESLGATNGSKALVDTTDEAIRIALGRKIGRRLDHIELTELTKAQARTYLSGAVGEEAACTYAAEHVLDNLPRVPMILRCLELALPELSSSKGEIDLEQLYSIAIKAWIIRDPSFAGRDIKSIWEALCTTQSLGSVPNSDRALLSMLIHSGLVVQTPSGWHTWAHYSVGEFFLACALFEEIRKFNAATLAKLNLIGSYNINRFLVPMCRRQFLPSCTARRARPVSASQYGAFLRATGWRRTSGYGKHPSYTAQDGTGFISGINDLEPERDVQPPAELVDLPVCGLSWYDAFAYCFWSGESLPDTKHLHTYSPLLPGFWYWCMDWNDERKAHVAVAKSRQDSETLHCGGVNPDFRHSRIGLIAVSRDPKGHNDEMI
jgi:hypothetical protein